MNSNKLLFAFAAALLASFAMAQVTVAPTVDDPAVAPYADTYVAIGNATDGASITQDVSVNVPEIFALHLGASSLDFDLEEVLANGPVNDIVCVYGNRDLDFGAFGQDVSGDPNQWVAGTRYEYANGGAWDASTEPEVQVIQLDGSPATRATQWPLVEFDGTGQLADKDGSIVCYRTFVMQKYTNDTGGWELEVSIDEDITGVNLYIQDNTRCTFNEGYGNPGAGGNGVPFAALTDSGGPVSLMSDEATTWGLDVNGDTAACGSETADFDGWLDDLIVVAAEIGMETPSMNNEGRTLTYTLMPFGH